MYFGSPFYIGMLAILFVATVGTYYLQRLYKNTICLLMVLNVFQHFLKFWIYPQYRGMGFTLYSTAYNMCSVLIIFSPVALLSQSRFLKNFVFFVGSAAGLGAIMFPFWYFGIPANNLGWDYFRFYICHALLFITSVLPLALKYHTPHRSECWHIGTGFIFALCLILLNNSVFMSMGLFPGQVNRDLYDQLQSVNPCMMMGPKEGFMWLTDMMKAFSPAIFLGNNPSGRYAPILWYAIPVFVGMNVISFLLFSLLERRKPACRK